MNPLRLVFRFVSFFVALLASAAARPPNVVVILADDQGWGDLSVNGNTNLRTPNIDSLARAGTTLDRFYVCPVCSPTRAEFLTGRYYPRSGVRGTDSGKERLDLDAKTVADAFKTAGYATGAFGKWHNGSQWPYHPNARGFDEFYGFSEGHWGTYFNPPLEHNGRPVRGRGYIVDDLTDHALAFIEANRANPFFCYVPFNTPHSPFSVPDEEWNRFKDSPVAQRGSEGDKENLPVTRAVLAMTDNLDRNIGRILARLDTLGLSRDTIVVYFSDNGPNSARWNGGMKGRKTSVDEGGVRSPFFIRWPGRIRAGATVPEIAGAIDLLPTLTALAGVARVDAQLLDGRDLSPLLRGAASGWPERLIFSTWAGRASVRSQRYRLDDRGALFDFTADPGQKTDVAAQHPDVTARLAAALLAWRKEMSPADIPVRNVGAPDARPIPVGYAAFPRTVLTAGDGTATGGARHSNRFPNSSYFTNWTSTADTLSWQIEVATAGTYAVELHYTCAPSDLGSEIELSFRSASLTGKINEAWNPPQLDGEDRVPRQESYVKDFRALALGTIRLEAGRAPLTLRATRVAGTQVMDLSKITLTLLP